MPTHLLEPPVVGPILADKDRVHRGLHIVIDASGARTAEERKRPIRGVKHHLLRLTRIGPHKRHPAIAQADMRDLHRRGHAIDQNNFMAPVELEGFAGIEAQRHISCRRGFPCYL